MKSSATGKHFLLCLFFFCSFLPARAQTTIYFSDTIVDPGTVFGASVKADGFSNILGAQFSVKWDPQVLRFVSLGNFGLELSLNDNFGTNMALSEGVMAFSWFDQDLIGVDLEDSTTLFAIQFEVIGSPDDTTSLRFWNQPAIPEISNTDFEVIPASFINSMVTVKGPSSVNFNSAPDKITLQDCYPNPFSDFTQLHFSIRRATAAVVRIRHVNGQVCFEEKRSFAAGTNALTFTRDFFRQPGTYYLQIVSPEFTVTQKLVFIVQ